MLNALSIRTVDNNTDQIPILIDELRRLRDWFIAHAPKEEQQYLLSRTDNFIHELELISTDALIDIDIG